MKREILKIKKFWENNFPNVEFVEELPIIRGFYVKAEVVTGAMVEYAKDNGYRLRHVAPALDEGYVRGIFEPERTK